MGPWSKAEIRFLKASFRSRGAEFVARHLQRSIVAVARKARSLRLFTNRPGPWTEKEKKYLRAHYGKKKRSHIARILKRNIPAVLRMERLLGLRTDFLRPWTEAEKNFVRANYRTMTYAAMAKKLNRTKAATEMTAYKMKLRKTTWHKWTRPQKLLVRRQYGRVPTRDIAAALGLTPGSVHAMAVKLGLRIGRRNLTEKEIDFIRKNHRTMLHAEIATRLGRSRNVIWGVLKRRGWTGNNPRLGRPYTEEEHEFIRRNYQSMQYKEIAGVLGRSIPSVETYARAHGWYKRQQRKPRVFTAGERAFIRSHWRTMPYNDIAQHLGRTFASVQYYASTQGWHKRSALKKSARRRPSLQRQKSNKANRA
jgi:hypothetical protein